MASTQLFLNGARVSRDFREALFDAANRAGVTPNEFCVTAAAEKPAASGRRFPGAFHSGDLDRIGFHSSAAQAERPA